MRSQQPVESSVELANCPMPRRSCFPLGFPKQTLPFTKELDPEAAAIFEAARALLSRGQHLELNVSNLAYVSLPLLGEFMKLKEIAQEAGLSIFLTCANGGFREVFRLTKLDTFFLFERDPMLVYVLRAPPPYVV